MAKYQRPGWFTQHIANPIVSFFTQRLGRSLRGSRVLAVRGRRSGEWRSTPVNPIEVSGERYLVAPRGETQWVRNLRAAGGGELRLGRTAEQFRATELPDAAKLPILRAYIGHWRAETGIFFGVSSDASDAELNGIAPNHPVFRIVGD